MLVTHNELIDVVGNRIRADIIAEVQQAKLYSIIADEVTNVANKEELFLVLRYVFNNEVKEVFVDFIEVERITGVMLAESIGSGRTSSICWKCMVSAGFHCWCSFKAIVQQSAPLAMYYHCASHQLNLAVVSACKPSRIQNLTLEFFSFSSKRQRLLDACIEKFDRISTCQIVKGHM